MMLVDVKTLKRTEIHFYLSKKYVIFAEQMNFLNITMP